MHVDRRSFLKMAGVGVGATLTRSIPPFEKPSSDTPNIVLCMADDQGWGDVAYNGHPVLKTPTLDAMAAEGLRFDRFYAAAPVCSPTRGSVMTGRHPNRFGCFKWGHTLRPQEVTLPEALKTVGYVTGHFGKWHLGPVRKGTPTNPGASGFDSWFSAPNFFDNAPILSREGTAVQTQGESSMVTVDAAIEFIRKHADTPQPFLTVVWFGSPHGPHEALGRYRSMYSDQEEKLQHLYGEITAMDHAIGKLRNTLRDLDIHENTLLWYCSDNGGLPEVGATGGRGHKGQIYEGGLRVPALLEWPGEITEPRATNVPCVTSDIYPTLLKLTGVQLQGQPPLDGISLVPLIEGALDTRPEPIGFWEHPERGVPTPSDELMRELLEAQKDGSELGALSHLRLEAWRLDEVYPQDLYPGHAAWLSWPWKLHRKQEDDKNGAATLELYNLAEDPKEANDLVPRDPDRARALRSGLENWQASVVRSLNGHDYE